MAAIRVVPASPQLTDSGKAVNKAWARLEALKKKIGDTSDLEKTLNTTPKIGGCSDELIVLEPEPPKISAGAQKLFERFYKHATAGKSSPGQEKTVENVKIVRSAQSVKSVSKVCEVSEA